MNEIKILLEIEANIFTVDSDRQFIITLLLLDLVIGHSISSAFY